MDVNNYSSPLVFKFKKTQKEQFKGMKFIEKKCNVYKFEIYE